MFGIGVTNFVYYYWYEWTRSGFEKAAIAAGRASSKLTTVESMVAGALAGSATVLITNPIWVVNTRMTARKKNNWEGNKTSSSLPGGGGASEPRRGRSPHSTFGTLLSLLRDEGPTALFAGVLPALVLVINPILQYTIFEQLKNLLERRKTVTAKDAFYLGAIGKLLATGITYPYITVKSRAHVAARDDARRQGMIQGLKNIVNNEGWTGLYNGKRLLCLSTPPFFVRLERVFWGSQICLRNKTNLQPIRHRTEAQPERPHRRLLVRIQGCPI